MKQKPPGAKESERARFLRRQQTKSESLLWALLRGGQLNGLKFRRQHPISPYFADFACVGQRLVIEIDGGYHDAVGEADLNREAYLRANGWRMIRFSDTEIENDVEGVVYAIARELGLEFKFEKRVGHGSGMMHKSAPVAPRQSVQDAMRAE
jgi:very-short-patch-repair endonuclease